MGTDWWRKLKVGWTRIGFDWPRLEPENNKWDLSFYDEVVKNASENNVTILPIFFGTPQWAAPTEPYSFDAKRKQYVRYEVFPGNQADITITCYVYGKDGNKIKQPYDRVFLPHRKDMVGEYVEMVREVVSRYSKPPYNLKYFQVHNETNAEYWLATMEEYVDDCLIPAAKIIREHGCYVVYGGWASCNSLDDYDYVLNYNDSWKYVDFLSFHYLSATAFDRLYNDWIANGKCKGIWETELGGRIPYPTKYGNYYSRVLSWGLKHDWSFPDKYKIFWYCLASDEEAFLRGPRFKLTPLGNAAHTFAHLFPDKQISSFDRFRTSPKLAFQLNENKDSIEGFKSGDTITLIVHLTEQTYQAIKDSPLEFTVGSLPNKPCTIQRISVDGSQKDIDFTYDKSASFKVSFSDLTPQPISPDAKILVFYISVKLNK